VLPPTHFEIGVSIHNLGDVALKGGHAERAAELYAQAIAFWESTPAAGKTYVSYSLVGLANALRDLGRFSEAKARYAEARARLAGPNAELEREIADGEARLEALRPAPAEGREH
jgi:tetratricopeptide (TPR) repeat protein